MIAAELFVVGLLQCATPAEILRTFQIQYKDGISQPEFVTLCPAIIYQLDQHVCHSEHAHPCHLHSAGHDAHCATHHAPSNQTESADDESSTGASSWKSKICCSGITQKFGKLKISFFVCDRAF